MNKPSPYVVLPVQKALAVLELVAESTAGLGLSDICAELKLPKTSAFRYLRTLVESGFVAFDDSTNTYSIGSKFRSLAKADSGLHRLRMIARPHMITLVNEFQETVNLAVMLDGAVNYVDVVEGTRLLRIQGKVGDRHPLHSTALGKAMLARLPETALQAELGRRPLVARTSRTLIDQSLLARQLRQVARQGYSTETGENADDAACVGAAIIDDGGYPIAAISLSAPRSRLSRQLLPKVGARMAEMAAVISRDLNA